MQCVGPEKGQPNSSNFPSPRRSYVWSIEQHEDAHRSKICTPILFANVNELKSFSFLALVVVAYSLLHRKPLNPMLTTGSHDSLQYHC